MKSLKVSAKQVKKLLEMCKALFTDFPHIIVDEFDSDEVRVIMFDKDSEKLWKNGNEDFDWDDVSEYEADVNIHWYEFCMNLLPKKIFNGKREPFTLSDWQLFRLSQTHPVDYLYEQFKKLK